MKRNNLFMLAYIIFIFLCGIAKMFYDYTMWPTILAAISTASWIFAIADFLYSQACEYEQCADEHTEHTEHALYEIEKMKDRIQKCIQLHEASRNNLDEEEVKAKLNHYKSIANQALAIEKMQNKILEKIKAKQKKGWKMLKWAKCLTCIAFLSLLCIMAFPEISTYAVAIQDLMTVFAFALILTTQYLENEARTNRENFNKHIEVEMDVYHLLIKSFEREAEEHAH